MNVLSFSYCFPSGAHPAWGVFVAQRLAALSKLADVQMVAPVPMFPLISRLRGELGPAREQYAGLDVHRPRYFYFPGILKSMDGRFYGRGLRRWLENICAKWRPDVLDAHFVWPDGVGVSMLAQQVGIPYTVTLRGQIYPCVEDSRRNECIAALRGAAAVISVSDPMAQLARELGVDEKRVHVIPNGVDAERFFPRDQADARRQLGLPAQGRLIVTVAHLGPRKGHHETIRALAELPDDVSLVLVGGDASGGGDTRAIRNLVGELGLTGRVILTGRQPFGKVPLYFNAADVSVLASYREGCPNVVLESLASGTPVVASRVGSVPQFITSPALGRIVQLREIAPLAAALNDVLGRPPQAADVAIAGAVKSWTEVADEVYGVLADAITR